MAEVAVAFPEPLPGPYVDEVIEVEHMRSLGRPTRCRLRLYRGADGRPLAIVTELAENEGFSVTNAAEIIWAALARRLDTTRFTMVEHYGPESWMGPAVELDTYDVVTVVAGLPGWRRIGVTELRLMQGA